MTLQWLVVGSVEWSRYKAPSFLQQQSDDSQWCQWCLLLSSVTVSQCHSVTVSQCHSVTTSVSCDLCPGPVVPPVSTVLAGHRHWRRSWASWPDCDWSPPGSSGGRTWSSWVAARGPGGSAGAGGSPGPLSSVCRGSCSRGHSHCRHHRSQCSHSSHWFSPGNSPPHPSTPHPPPPRSPGPGPGRGSGWGRAGRAPPSSLQQVRSGQVSLRQGRLILFY